MRALAVAMIAVAAIVAACGQDTPPCYRGDFVTCTCRGGRQGYAACRQQQDGYGACVCDGTTPGLDAGPAEAGPADAADAAEEAP